MPATSASDPALRIRRPGDLIDAIPYLMGFHPTESLVLVGLRDRSVLVTARVDLDGVAGPDGAALLHRTLRTLANAGAGELVGAVFTEAAPDCAAEDRPEEQAVPALEPAARQYGIVVLDTLIVRGGRWWSYQCADPRCCPPEGHPVLGLRSATAAAATYAGMVARPRRDDVERLLDPDPDAGRLDDALGRAEDVAVQAILDGAVSRWRRAETRALFTAARSCDRAVGEAGWVGVDDRQMARFGVALGDIHVRDSVWLALEGGRFGPTQGRELWQRLATGLPAAYAAPPLFLFGWSAWRAGSGLLAGIAVERALACDPSYSAAHLLRTAVEGGMDPFRTPRLRAPRTRRSS